MSGLLADPLLACYRQRAPCYDLELLAFEPLRRDCIARLELQPGQTVLDLGCGTGLSLPWLLRRTGAGGRVLAVDQCPEMLERAARRVDRHGWRNVELIESAIEQAVLPGQADAALFHFTHDILQSPASLRHVRAHLRRGARVAAAGLMWAPYWALTVNMGVLGAALYSVNNLGGLERPWAGLLPLCGELEVSFHLGGGAYIASGCVV